MIKIVLRDKYNSELFYYTAKYEIIGFEHPAAICAIRDKIDKHIKIYIPITSINYISLD